MGSEMCIRDRLIGDAVQCFPICAHLTRTRHSTCEQSYEARKLCPATDIIDLFLVLFGSVFLVLACDHRLSTSSFDFLHFVTLPTLPEHEVWSAIRVTATQKTMFAAATVVSCRLKWEGWLCVMLCVCIIPFGESSFCLANKCTVRKPMALFQHFMHNLWE